MYYSYASFTVPLVGKVFFTTVKVINPKNNKSVNVLMLVDSGAQNSQIDGTKFAEPLGIDLKSGVLSTSYGVRGVKLSSYRHVLNLQIGNLPVLTNVPVFLTDSQPQFNNLGWNGALEKLYTTVTPTKLTISDTLALGQQAQAAMGRASAYFRSRI